MQKYGVPIAALISGLILLIISFSTDLQVIQAICAVAMLTIDYLVFRWAKERGINKNA